MKTVTITREQVAAHHLTITDEPTRVTILGLPFTVEIISDGAADVWYTLDETEPQPRGERCYLMPAGGRSVDERATNGRSQLAVTLIAEGTAVVSIQRGS